MRPGFKKIIIIGAGMGLLVVSALMVASFYLNSEAFRERLIAEVNGAIKGSLRLANQQISLLTGRLALSGVELAESDGKPVAAIKQLRARIFWPALAWRALHITSLEIEQADVSLIYDRKDRLNILQAVAPTSPKGTASGQGGLTSWQVRLDDFRLHRASIVFQRPAKGWTFSGERIEAEGHGNLAGRSGSLNVRIGRVVAKTVDHNEVIDNLMVSAAYDERSAHPIILRAQTDDTLLAAQADLDWHSRIPSVVGTCELELALDRLQAWLPKKLQLSGRAVAKLTVKGQLNDPSATATVSVTHGGAAGVSFQKAELSAELDHRKIALNRFSSESQWGNLDISGTVDLQPVFPQTFQRPAAGIEAAAYTFEIQGRKIKPKRISRLGFTPDGTWHGRIRLAGAGISSAGAQGNAQLDLQVDGLQWGAATPSAEGRLAIKAQWRNQVLEIQSLNATLGNSALQADGRIHWARKEVAGQALLHTKQLADMGALFGIRLPEGNATLKASGQGPWQKPSGHLSLLAEDLSMAGWTFGRLTAEADLGDTGVISVSRLDLENRGGSLQGEGQLALIGPDGVLYRNPALKAILEINQLELADFTSQSPVNLWLNGQLKIDGTLLHPGADLTLSRSPIHWRDIECRADGSARWDDGRLTVPHLHLSKGDSAVDLQGTANWRDRDTNRWTSNPLLNIELLSDSIQLEDLLSAAKGAVVIRASVEGSASALKGRFQLTSGVLAFNSQKADGLELEGRLADNTVHLDHLTLTLAPGQQVQGHGWYALDQRFEAALNASGLALSNIDVLQKARPISGRLDLDLNAHGTLKQPELTGRLLIHHPVINNQAWNDFHMQVQLRDRRLEADADLNFKCAGHYQLGSGDFALSAEFDHTDLTPYLAIFAGVQWEGRLSGRLQATGNRHAVDQIKAQAVLSQIGLTYEKIDLIKIEQLEAHLDKGMLNLPATRMQLMQGGHVTVSGKGNIFRDLALQADGRVPMAALVPFTDELGRASGEMIFDMQANGPWNRMQWRADLALANIGCVITDLDQSVHDLNGRMQINAQRISVESLSGMLEDGHFSLGGQIQLSDLRPTRMDLTFSVQALPLQWPETMDMKIAADLTLRGDAPKLMLEGHIVLLEGSYYKNLRYNLLSAISQPQRAEPVPSVWSPPKEIGAINLNVAITHRYPFLVDNNIARLDVAPDLKVTGTVANPIISGRAKVVDGEVFFRGKSFTVNRGVVDFINPYKIEPSLDIEAQAQIRQWTVTLLVSGTPDNLMIKLSSDPPESDADVLSLILLGRTSAEVSQGSGGATTGQMLAALAASSWGEDIKKSTGVDILELETGQGSVAGENGMQLTVGKHLTRRLTVKYAVESGNEQLVQKAISEYRLLEHVLASGFQDTAGNYGGELLFRIEFR